MVATIWLRSRSPVRTGDPETASVKVVVGVAVVVVVVVGLVEE
jgi:hypothetical protein